MGAVEAEDRRGPLPRGEPADAVPGKAARKERLGFIDDPAVRTAEEEPQPIAPPGPDDVAVAEIQAKQLGVVGRGELDRLRRGPPASRAGAPFLRAIDETTP